MPDDTLWAVEPHTLAKHEILRRYLGAWFGIMNRYNRSLLYLDGFCGPGQYKDGEPGSPIIALKLACDHVAALDAATTFWFIDHRPDRIEHLQSMLVELEWPSNFTVSVDCGEFEDVFRRRHDTSKPELSLPPTFAFLDPFGFSGMPYELVARILACQRCEVFLNLSVNSINRFLEHPNDKIRDQILQAFGTEEVLAIPERDGDRIEAFRLLYQAQLENAAKFVRFFEMRDRRNQIPYYLFFATNHPLGFEKMKEAMWKVDPDGDFAFSDRTDPHMEALFADDCSADMARVLLDMFSNAESTTAEAIYEYVVDRTPYLKKHARAALRLLESEGRIEVGDTKVDGGSRRQGTFPHTALVSFVPDAEASSSG